MLQRTNGRLLLALLVVTGFAGTIDNNTISLKERKQAVEQLKSTRKELLYETKKLTNKQLNFLSPELGLTIKKCIYQSAISESKLWSVLDNALLTKSDPEKRLAINFTDENIVTEAEKGTLSLSGDIIFKQANIPLKSATTAINGFLKVRNSRINYLRTSTEDLRNHIVQTPVGWTDAYQYILLIGAQTKKYISLIQRIKEDPAFPVTD